MTTLFKIKMLESALEEGKIEVAEEIIKELERKKLPPEISARVKSIQANVNIFTENYTDALESLMELMRIYDSLEHTNPSFYKMQKIDAMLRIGQVYLQLENEPSSEKYIVGAVLALESSGPEIRSHPDYETYLGIAYLTLGIHYKLFNKNILSEEYHKKAMTYLREVNNPALRILLERIYNFLAEVNIAHGEYAPAIKNIEAILKRRAEQGQKENVFSDIEYGRALMNLGWIMLKKNALAMAERYLLEAESILSMSNVPVLYTSAKRLLALTYLKEENVIDGTTKILEMMNYLLEKVKTSRGINLFYRLLKNVRILHEAIFFIKKSVVRGSKDYCKKLYSIVCNINAKLNDLWNTIQSLPISPNVQGENDLKYAIISFKKLENEIFEKTNN